MVHGGTLDDGPFRGEVAEEDGETAHGVGGLLHRTNRVGVQDLLPRQVLADRFSRDGHIASVMRSRFPATRIPKPWKNCSNRSTSGTRSNPS